MDKTDHLAAVILPTLLHPDSVKTLWSVVETDEEFVQRLADKGVLAYAIAEEILKRRAAQ